MILGIDEVGRGAWAGPLVVGACILNGAKIEGLTDSKKLTKKQREKLNLDILNSDAIVALGWVSSGEVDDIGLGESLRLATRRAVEEIQKKCKENKVIFDEIIIDGTINFLSGTKLEPYVKTLKKADLLISSVSAAAICAKVARDNFMSDLDKQDKYSKYSFSSHVGYGTKKHKDALELYGVTDIHRKSFKPIAQMSKSKNTNSKITTKKIGDKAEKYTEGFLQKNGHSILSRNWKTKLCEIDIVSEKDSIIYFTEVKYRKNDDFGGSISAISNKKLAQMQFAAELYLSNHNLVNDYRMAVAIIEGEDYEKFEWFEI